MNDEPILYPCNCDCGAVAVSTLDLGDDDQFICISLWRHGVDGYQASWRNRLNHIWHIIKHGHPYTDTVLLELERAHELGSRLREMAEDAVTPRTEKSLQGLGAPATFASEARPKLRAPTAVKVWPKRKLVAPCE